MFRPWNDTRFHARPPVKEHVGLAVGYEGAGGYYIELSLDGLLVAGGLYRPAPDQLDRIRRAVDARRARARARPARVPGRPSAAGPAALQEPDRDPPPRARSVAAPPQGRAHD